MLCKAQRESKSKSESASASESESKSEGESEGESESGSEGGSKGESESKSESESKNESGRRSESEKDGECEKDSERESESPSVGVAQAGSTTTPAPSPLIPTKTGPRLVARRRAHHTCHSCSRATRTPSQTAPMNQLRGWAGACLTSLS